MDCHLSFSVFMLAVETVWMVWFPVETLAVIFLFNLAYELSLQANEFSDQIQKVADRGAAAEWGSKGSKLRPPLL